MLKAEWAEGTYRREFRGAWSEDRLVIGGRTCRGGHGQADLRVQSSLEAKRATQAQLSLPFQVPSFDAQEVVTPRREVVGQLGSGRAEREVGGSAGVSVPIALLIRGVASERRRFHAASCGTPATRGATPSRPQLVWIPPLCSAFSSTKIGKRRATGRILRFLRLAFEKLARTGESSKVGGADVHVASVARNRTNVQVDALG